MQFIMDNMKAERPAKLKGPRENTELIYRIARNFGGKNIWRIALIMAFGGFYFGGWVSLIP